MAVKGFTYMWCPYTQHSSIASTGIFGLSLQLFFKNIYKKKVNLVCINAFTIHLLFKLFSFKQSLNH